MYSIGTELKHVKLKELRPSQVTVGFREVDKKRRPWARLGPKDKREAMRRELIDGTPWSVRVVATGVACTCSGFSGRPERARTS